MGTSPQFHRGEAQNPLELGLGARQSGASGAPASTPVALADGEGPWARQRCSAC